MSDLETFLDTICDLWPTLSILNFPQVMTNSAATTTSVFGIQLDKHYDNMITASNWKISTKCIIVFL